MSKGKQTANHLALYRKYRSKTLSEVVGQEHITDILTRALKQGKVAHAYLFTGPRGVGKTSVARILAHEINNLPYDETTQHPDIIEIDAASNRRIDDIRDLRDKVQIAPAQATYKVYIIDEVHMLTGESFNAFLKTLEEPPEHVVFILATTDAHKLPVTITSRTQRFAFRAIAPAAAQAHLRSIADAEHITIDDEAIALVVTHGDGSFRDSISLLDQLSSLADKDQTITRELVEGLLGMASGDQIEALLGAYKAGDRQAMIEQLATFEQQGIAAPIIANQLIRMVRDHIVEHPRLITLLDLLTTISSSPRPEIKLLTALLAHSTPRKTVATTVSADLKPLAKEATKAKPNERNVRSSPIAPALSSSTAEQAETALEVKSEPVERTQEKKRVDFDWNGYVAYMKEHHVALASILAKCKAESDGTVLTVYTGTAFWKKKLDNVKYQPVLHDALVALHMSDLTIETIPSTMPPKDSQAAAVAAIMGGGEEISLSE